MTLTRKSHRNAILRALARRSRTKNGIIKYLGAQDAYDAVDYDLQQLRKDGLVVYSHGYWTLTVRGIDACARFRKW